VLIVDIIEFIAKVNEGDTLQPTQTLLEMIGVASNE
jgi:hypothetical protein